MAAQTVLVTQLTGQAWIRNTDGTLTAIHEGMRIAADAVIVTSSGGSVQLQADGQPPLIVGENQEVLLTADLVAPPQPQEAAIAAPPATEIDQIIAAINAGQDPFDTLDPTAATLSGGSEGGSTFVRLASVVEATAPLNLAFDRTGAGPADTLFAADGAAAPATPDTNPDIGSVLEDALPLTGNLLTNDTLGDGSLAQHSVLLRGGSQGQFGQITLNSDGSYSYQLDNALPAVQALAAGETRTETFTYELVDRNGASSINTLTITIIGTNDAPTLSGEATVAVQEDQTTAVSGQLVAADVDVGDTQTWSVNNGGQGQYGSFTVDQTGKWTYVPGAGNAQVQGLKTGEQLTDTVTVTVSDGKGGSATQTVTVVIEGADDAAIITPAAPGSDLGRVQEDVTLTTSGKLDVTDPDAGQAVFVAQVAAAGQYGSFSVDAGGNWSFALDNGGETVQALGAGETVTETFTVTTADGTKGSVVITIVGTNDQPELSGALTGTVTENGIQTAIGQMITTDVDAKDTHSYSVIGNATGTYGSFSVDANGQWTYQLDNDAAQPLRAGETRTETYQVQVSDGKGGVDTQTVTITINGADVSAIITPAVPGADRGAVTEDGQLSAVGKLNVVDPDEGQAVFVAVTARAGQYGSFSIDADGNWNYALNNNSPLVQSLGTGETRTESFTVTTADGTTGSVVITINGTNDQPVLSGALTGTVTEDGTQTAIGQLATTDVDTLDTHSYTVVGSATGTYGSFSVNASGQWAYQLNNAAAQPLNAGETRTETYQVEVSDGKGGVDIKDITITINGTDEGVVVVPGIPGNDAGAVQEDVTLQAGGKLEATDPDAPAVVFVPQTNVAGQYGSFSVDASGNWTFALNNSDAKVQALAANETRSETFTVTTADGAASSVVITITGSNDAPTITGMAAAAISDSTASISGDLNPSDVDAGDTHTWSVGTPQGQYGSLTVDADGKWTYVLDSAKVKDLPDGQKVTDTITVTVTDSHGATGTKDVVITINGSGNNTPTIGGAATGEVTEDIKLSVQGALTISDPDAGQSTFVAQ
ncbi:MAG: retention module-containing protein, partial [Comamonas sp.]|uniref:retention module-containing protein n=1 Tax=Comamonas sp. TaxID=34028 RepID=UPI002FCA8CB0